MKQLFQLFIFALLVSGGAATFALAQQDKTAVPENTPTPSASPAPQVEEEPALYTYQVLHDHRIGKGGEGELRVTKTGFEFRGENPKEEKHYQVWRDEDIKRLEFKDKEIRIYAYEAARYPLVPRQVPYIKGKKDLRVGSERKYVFQLVEGEITPDVVSLLMNRFKRPLTTSVLPFEEAETGKLLFEIPVFYRRRSGGVSGNLQVFEQYAVFAAEESPDDSRFWRYEDIRDIGRLGRWRFEIASYENQFLADGKSYIFDLKRPMSDAEYEKLWAKIYERDQSPRLRRAPVREKTVKDIPAKKNKKHE